MVSERKHARLEAGGERLIRSMGVAAMFWRHRGVHVAVLHHLWALLSCAGVEGLNTTL